MICSLYRNSDQDSIVCWPAIANETSTDDSDLGVITVCRAMQILFLLGFSVTVEMPVEKTGQAEIPIFRPIALMYKGLKALGFILRIAREMPCK